MRRLRSIYYILLSLNNVLYLIYINIICVLLPSIYRLANANKMCYTMIYNRYAIEQIDTQRKE